MYKRILVPVDGSIASMQGLNGAVRLAQGNGATLKLVHLVNELVLDGGYPPVAFSESVIVSLREVGRKVLEESVASARKQNVAVESELIETIGGRAAAVIVAVAIHWQADLIVLGTHGRRGLRRLAMGSDAEEVLRTAPVPVLMVRASDDSSRQAA